MSQFFFIGAFLAIGIPSSFLLAKTDPEPDMADLSLLLFCFVGAASSLMAYIASSRKLHREPGVLNGLCAGAIAASLFFLSLSFVPKFDLWPCLLLALILAATLAAASPLMGVKKNA